jgi:hypothetical protein
MLLHWHRWKPINATTSCEHPYPMVNVTTMRVGMGNNVHELNEHGEPQCRFLIYYSCRCGRRHVEVKWTLTPEEEVIGRRGSSRR